MSATVRAEGFSDRMGTKHLTRHLGLSKARSPFVEDQVAKQLFEICIDVLRYAPDVFSQLQKYSRTLTKVTRSRSHKMYKKNRALRSDRPLGRSAFDRHAQADSDHGQAQEDQDRQRRRKAVNRRSARLRPPSKPRQAI